MSLRGWLIHDNKGELDFDDGGSSLRLRAGKPAIATNSCLPAMARVASNPVGVHRFRPFFFRSSPPHNFLSNFKSRRFPSTIIACKTNPIPTENHPTSDLETVLSDPTSPKQTSTEATSSSSSSVNMPEFPNKTISRQIAVVSSLVALGLFVSARLDFGVSLKDLSAAALPYEQALSNGKPTVVEFYADWCEVCRELAPDIYKVEQQYRDRVNFVMLNVDNTKWEQELDEFGVEGIPHFAFLDKEGNEEGNIVGRLPRQYFLENVEALSRGEMAIPHASIVGQYSSAESRKVHQVSGPRSHG